MLGLEEYLKKIGWWWTVVVLPIARLFLGISDLEPFLTKCNITILTDIPVWVWVSVTFIVFVIANFTAYNKIRMERDKFINQYKEEINKFKEHWPFISDLRLSQITWGLWYTGTTPSSDKAINYKQLTRILLVEPESNGYNRILQESGENHDLAKMKIITLTNEAIATKRTKLRWYSDYMPYSMTIFDPTPLKIKSEYIPNSPNAYIVLKHLAPVVGPSDRTMERINRRDSKFVGYFEKYESLWLASKEQSKIKTVPIPYVDKDLEIVILESESHSRISTQSGNHKFEIPYTLKTRCPLPVDIARVTLYLQSQNIKIKANNETYKLENIIQSHVSTFELSTQSDPTSRSLAKDDKYRLIILAFGNEWISDEFTISHIGLTIEMPALEMKVTQEEYDKITEGLKKNEKNNQTGN